MELLEKFEKLKQKLCSLENVAIAFSGGVDSTFLLKTAYDVLGDKVLAITAQSSTYPEREYKLAVDFVKENNIRHITVLSEELEVEGFSQNPANRCYLCKKELMNKIVEIANKNNIKYILEGSNLDDLSDYRPGMKALEEFGILSPLRDFGFVKDEIRTLSKKLGLKTWNKPSFACLASRFPYGHIITKEKLKMVDLAEQYLLDLGFVQVRVRHHNDIARIELPQDEIIKLIATNLMQKIDEKFKQIGFTYVTLDLKGYRTGSMNEALKLNSNGLKA